MSATHSERERFVAELVRHAPAADSVLAARLMRYSGTFHRLAARDGSLRFAEQRKFERIKMKIAGLCLDIRCQAVFGSDWLMLTTPDNYSLEVPRI